MYQISMYHVIILVIDQFRQNDKVERQTRACFFITISIIYSLYVIENVAHIYFVSGIK